MPETRLRNPLTAVRTKTLPVLLSALVGLASGSMSFSLPGIAAEKHTPATSTKKGAAKPASTATPSKDAKDSTTKDKTAKEGTKDKEKSKEAIAKEINDSIAAATPVSALDVMKAPADYLNKKVTFTATFNRFADIGLDYKKAFRDSRDYVTFFILRPDVTVSTIPLSEMKLFFPRKKSDEVMELESGDKIQLVGSTFSTALDEPWIDVEHIKILEKTAKPEKKHQPLEF